MNYSGYVAAAYAVFVVVLAWDFVAPQLRLRVLRRNVRRAAAREQRQAGAGITTMRSS